MKIMSLKEENLYQQRNINFGLNNRCLKNSEQLIAYWKSKGFSDACIQKAMRKLDNYASRNVFDTIRSFFSLGIKREMHLKKYPAIDIGNIEQNIITRILPVENPAVKTTYSATETTVVPNIVYKFEFGDLPMPFNKKFVIPLERTVETYQGKTVEPFRPLEIVKEMIKSFKEFKRL